jgi:adenylate cyclase
LGGLHCNDGHPNEALAALSKAMRASPHDPLMWVWMLWVAATQFYASNFQGAVDAADRLIRFRPDKSNAYRFKAAALAHLGEIGEAKQSFENGNRSVATEFRVLRAKTSLMDAGG